MEKLALLATLEAKPGKEEEVAEFIKSVLPMVQQETETIKWYGLRIGPSTFGIFDTFSQEDARLSHLNGAVAQMLIAKASYLLAKAPAIVQVELLAVK